MFAEMLANKWISYLDGCFQTNDARPMMASCDSPHEFTKANDTIRVLLTASDTAH